MTAIQGNSSCPSSVKAKPSDLMKDRLVKLMKRRWLTPLDALQLAGCLSLSQRCGELRRAGLPVEDKWVELENGKRVKGYRLASQPRALPASALRA